ncbi:MAG: THUMP domain-containing class I SAM-dependent RNA methyltransferase [Myxococcales bacterium]
MKLVATAARGTEDLLAAELRALSLARVRQVRGAVTFEGTLAEALRACVELRTAMRVLLSLGELPAPGPEGLYDSLRTLRWTDHLDLRHTFAIEVSGQSEGLTHSLFVAQKAKDAIADSLRAALGARPDVDTRDPDVRIVLHLHAGRAEVSLDVAGDSLHRRGWREAPHRASLKETLAAALLLASGWKGEVPLCDPMCGAGTIAIEAALLAEGRAPNARRRFGAERWPAFGAAERQILGELREAALSRARRERPPIFAGDRDPEAVASARENAKRAGVALELREADARELAPPAPAGTLVSNPPYGGRAGGGGGGKQLKSFFHGLGLAARGWHGWTLAYLAGSEAFESAFGMRPTGRRKLYNGPIPCELLSYRVR